MYQGSTLEKKPWGQLPPKFLDLVASTNFLVAKKFSAIRDENIYLKNMQYKLSTLPSLRREGKVNQDEKPYVKKTLMLHRFRFIIFHWQLLKKYINCRKKML